MIFTGFVALLLALQAAGYPPAKQYYLDLGCTRVPPVGPVIKYDCPALTELQNDTCYYNGKHYSVGEVLKDEDIEDKCVAQCTCLEFSGQASFSCANIECPDHVNPQFEKGCAYLYKQGECCPFQRHCDNVDPPLPTCEYDGKVYKEGEKIYPKSKECLSCICSKDFNGTLSEPWCVKSGCDMFLHYGSRIREGCIPTYYNLEDCCPIPIWRCPDETTTVVEPKLIGGLATTKSRDEFCSFGNLKLAPGERLSQGEEKCVECSCIVPPHVSCVMNTTCYESG